MVVRLFNCFTSLPIRGITSHGNIIITAKVVWRIKIVKYWNRLIDLQKVQFLQANVCACFEVLRIKLGIFRLKKCQGFLVIAAIKTPFKKDSIRRNQEKSLENLRKIRTNLGDSNPVLGVSISMYWALEQDWSP